MLTVFAYTDPFLLHPADPTDQYGVVRATPDGGAVGFWLNSILVPGDIEPVDFRVRFLDGFAPKGGNGSALPLPASGISGVADLQVLSGGSMVVSFLGLGQPPGFNGGLQLLNADGTLLGAQIDLGRLWELSVEALHSGGFAVGTGRINVGNFNNLGDVWAHFFDATGQETATAVQLNKTRAGTQDQVALSGLAAGGIVAVWRDDSRTSADKDGTALIGRIFRADGSAAGQEFLINTSFTGDQNSCVVTELDNGNFVAVWRSEDNNIGGTGESAIHARIFRANGTALGAEFVIDSVVPSQGLQPSLSFPKVTTLPDGRFAVVWSYVAGDQFGGQVDETLLQVFEANGAAASVIYTIGDSAASVSNPTIDTMADGRIVVSYSQLDDLGRPDAYTQILDSRDSGISLDGNAFDNQYFGTLFADRLSGADGADTLDGSSGNDTLAGGIGDDDLYGANGKDFLTGNQGNDVLVGGLGGDVLQGGSGNDILIGGAGNDRFIFKPGDGADVIRAFTNGADTIDLSQYSFTGFRDAAKNFVAHARGVEFQMGADSIIIVGFDLADLTRDDLIL